MEWLIIPIVTVLGMAGGQFLKGQRRWGIPAASIMFSWKKKKWRSFAYALLIAVLSMGYGEDSFMYKLCGGLDWLVRLIYGLLIGIIVAFAGCVYAVILMPLAFMFRCNLSFKVGKFDFIFEDFVRYLTLGTCIYMSIR